GNGNEIFVGNAFRTHELGLQTLLARLAQQQTELGVVATKIDQVGIQALELGNDRRVIAVAYVDTLKERNIGATFAEVIAHLCGNAGTVGLLVVQDGNGFRLDGIDDVVGRKGALLVIATDGAKEIMRLDGV